MKYKTSLRAEDDLIEIWLHIATDSQAAADRLLDRLESRWQLLAAQPRSGVQRDDLGPGLRCVVVGEYLTFYRLDSEIVEILRVLHGRRDIAGDDFAVRS